MVTELFMLDTNHGLNLNFCGRMIAELNKTDWFTEGNFYWGCV